MDVGTETKKEDREKQVRRANEIVDTWIEWYCIEYEIEEPFYDIIKPEAIEFLKNTIAAELIVNKL